MSARWMKWPLVGAVAIAAADQAIKSVVLTAQPHVTVIPGSGISGSRPGPRPAWSALPCPSSWAGRWGT